MLDDDPTDLGSTTVDLVLSDTNEDKFNKLDIDAQLQISLLAGLIKLSGSGAYFQEERKSARTARMSLVYKVRSFRVSKEMPASNKLLLRIQQISF